MNRTTDRVRVKLTGVPETMLWPLHNRAGEARRRDAMLHDPEAVRIAEAIDYDFAASFGKPDFSHALRAIVIDAVLRDWLVRNPTGTVIGLGEGLETQFHRVDNGRLRWLSVDLPEAIDVRRRFMPDTERHRNLACSALDLRWMLEVDRSAPVFVTAAGLLMYFQPDEVNGLVAAIAERLNTAEMVFDVIPRWFSRKTLRGYRKTPSYTTPPMPWGLNRDELPWIKLWHPNIAEVRELPLPTGRGFLFRVLVPLIRCLPWLGNRTPSIVHLICRPGS